MNKQQMEVHVHEDQQVVIEEINEEVEKTDEEVEEVQVQDTDQLPHVGIFFLNLYIM